MSKQVQWFFCDKECESIEDCLSQAKNTKCVEAFAACKREDAFLQASGSGDGPYQCEITFTGRDLSQESQGYSPQKRLMWDEMADLMRRFSDGDDFSFAKTEWELSFDPEANALDYKKKLNAAKCCFSLALMLLIVVFVYFALSGGE